MIWNDRAIDAQLRDVLHVLARMRDEVRHLSEQQNRIRETLDGVLLQMAKQNEQGIGLAALLQAEVETEEEREAREKAEAEFKEIQALLQRIEEV